MRLEQHCHSTASDGYVDYAHILDLAIRQELGAVFVTDHDKPSDDFVDIARDQGIISCPSTEMSISDPDLDQKQLHMTIYAAQFSERFYTILQNILAGRKAKITGQIQNLKSNGIIIDKDAFYEHRRDRGADEHNLNIWHLAEYIWSNPDNIKIIKRFFPDMDMREFITHCLKRTGKYAYFGSVDLPRYEPTVQEITAELMDTDTVMSLAHPNFAFAYPEDLIWAMRRYHEMGVNGIEINCLAKPEWLATILKLQKDLGLVLTFGTDCHFKPNNGDGLHGDFGHQHPNLTPEFIQYHFQAFRHKTGI